MAALCIMVDVKVRNLDVSVAAALRTRAKNPSLEEEVRRSLAETVVARQKAFALRAAACRAAVADAPVDDHLTPSPVGGNAMPEASRNRRLARLAQPPHRSFA